MAVDTALLVRSTKALTAPRLYVHLAAVVSVSRNSVELDCTNFFPNLSAQPSDKGRIIRVSDGLVTVINDAEFDGKKVIHYGQEIKLLVGDLVRCEIDEERRDYFSRAHSAAVLVSGLAHNRWSNAVVTSCDLSETRIRLDFADGPQSDADVEWLIGAANNAIASGGEVNSSLVSIEEVQQNPSYIRSHVLEQDFGGIGSCARLVRVTSAEETVEAQLDLGTHVQELREIGRLRPGSIDGRAARANKGVDHFRMRFCLEP